MAWEPIEVSEELIRGFAQSAEAFCEGLDPRGRQIWATIIQRAGGDGQGAPSEPVTGRYGHEALSTGSNGVGTDADGAACASPDDTVRALLGVWEPGTTIAPLYSGDMPQTSSVD